MTAAPYIPRSPPASRCSPAARVAAINTYHRARVEGTNAVGLHNGKAALEKSAALQTATLRTESEHAPAQRNWISIQSCSWSSTPSFKDSATRSAPRYDG
jgi:hypothetical protein